MQKVLFLKFQSKAVKNFSRKNYEKNLNWTKVENCSKDTIFELETLSHSIVNFTVIKARREF